MIGRIQIVEDAQRTVEREQRVGDARTLRDVAGGHDNVGLGSFGQRLAADGVPGGVQLEVAVGALRKSRCLA